MRTFNAFLKKEILETIRTGKLFIVLIISALFGIMNPAIAKLTPWMMKTLSASLEESGLEVKEVVVDALTSWTQFYKNMPILIIIFVCVYAAIYVNEYQKGTLVTIFTKGLSRWKVYAAKFTILSVGWTLAVCTCYLITFLYNMYFWDNSIASYHFIGAVYYWVFGMMIVSLIAFFSTIASQMGGVLLGTGGVAVICYIIGMIPKAADFSPTKLMSGMELLQGISAPEDYIKSLCVTVVISLICNITAVMAFNKKVL